MRHGDRGWVIVAAVVMAVEVTAGEGELLSEAVDRYLVSRPWLTRAVVAMLALHVANVLPQRLDPIHGGFVAIRRVNSRPVL
jgi:hypothetical protein